MNILSLDGGGIYGVHTAIILSRLEQAHPGFIAKTDMIAGTSVGGMIALAIAKGCTLQQIMDMCTNASAFFTTDLIRDAKSDIGDIAYYDGVGRKTELSSMLGATTTLGQLGKFVAIQSFQLNDKPVWNSKVFHNIPGGVDCPDSCTSLAVDAGMATSAAPVYFPVYGNFTDGGVVANNPAVTALSLTQDSSFNWPFKNTPFGQIKIFSIGRTYPGDAVDRSNWDAGWAKWISVIIEMLLSGNQGLVDYQCRQFLGNNFFRHSAAIPSALNFSIDDADDVLKLIPWANGLDLSHEIAWVNANW